MRSVKGLSDDKRKEVFIDKGFPHDREYALIKSSKRNEFDENVPKWIHKENFLCAFTRNELMATFDSTFDDSSHSLTVWKRKYDVKGNYSLDMTRKSIPLLSCVSLNSEIGKEEVSQFFSDACGQAVELVSAAEHQFGNTRAGVKARNDTRTCHIINAATVREVSKKIGINLNPVRFRPNIIVDGLEPWAEFDNLIGKQLVVDTDHNETPITFDICSRTVRCDGIAIDPTKPEETIDLPNLLNKHYPQYGPYLGVYAVVDIPGLLAVGDKLILKDH